MNFILDYKTFNLFHFIKKNNLKFDEKLNNKRDRSDENIATKIVGLKFLQ